MKKVSLYGLQRTGTNLLRWVMDRNFLMTIEQNNKHYPFTRKDVSTRAQPIIIITKNIYSWLPSIYHWRKVSQKLAIKENEIADGISFQDFIIKSSDPIKRWNRTNLNFATEPIDGLQRVFVKYEDLYKDIEGVTRNIAEQLKIPFKGGKFVLPTGRINSSNKETKKTFDASYYTYKKYLRAYTPELLNHVYRRVDPAVLEILNYGRNA